MKQEQITEQILTVLKKNFPHLQNLGSEDSWHEGSNNKLDSLQSLKLVYLFENHFKIRFTPAELTRNNFKNALALSQLIEKKTSSRNEI